jgi:hypothetical protein
MREFRPLLMSEDSVPPATRLVSISAEEQVAVWGHQQLKALGFSRPQSEAIVAAKRSWHEAADLLAAGCERDLACLILA